MHRDPLGHAFFQIMNAGAALVEATVAHDQAVQIDVGVDAFDERFGKRDAHASESFVTRFAVGDEFADHAVVVGRHGVAGVYVAVETNAGTAGHMQSAYANALLCPETDGR